MSTWKFTMVAFEKQINLLTGRSCRKKTCIRIIMLKLREQIQLYELDIKARPLQ